MRLDVVSLPYPSRVKGGKGKREDHGLFQKELDWYERRNASTAGDLRQMIKTKTETLICRHLHTQNQLVRKLRRQRHK